MQQTAKSTNLEAFPPVQLFGHDPADKAQLDRLRAEGSIRETHDTITHQLCELVTVRHAGRTLSTAELDAAIDTHLAGCSVADYGRWVFYPWSGRLVRVLDRDEFREVRFSRNRLKITAEEQARLQSCVIGVVGLSVGNSIARTLALEGVGTLVLADFDSLDLSNLNRLQASLHELGQNKAVIAARQILELDPYINVRVYNEGVTDHNLAGFLDGPPRIDLLVEECDSLEIKFLLREQARARRIPVLMETSDRGMLDVERFDEEPDRPLLHGLLRGRAWTDLRGLTTDQKVAPVLAILGSNSISARMAASLMEVKRSQTTWPQLGSDVTLGGATVASAARRIVTGLPLASGRRYVDLSEILGSPVVSQSGQTATEADPASTSPKLTSTDQVNAVQQTAGGESLALELIQHALLAPSAGNCQPWLFHVENDRTIHLVHDRARSRNLLDVDGLASQLALGAAIENMHLAATHRRGRLVIRPFPHPNFEEWVATLRFEPVLSRSIEGPDPLHRVVPLRGTIRHNGSTEALSPDETIALETAATERDAMLQLLTKRETLDEVGALLGEADRIRFLCADLHREAMQEMRWTPQQAASTRDGIDLATLDLTESEAAAFRVTARPDAVAILRQLDLGKALTERTQKALAGACAVGLLRVKGSTPGDFLQAGRSLQRVWLSATHLGLGLQPMGVILFMHRMLSRPEGQVFNQREQHTVRRLSERINSLFSENSTSAPAMLFRLVRTDKVTKRTLRRPQESFVRWGRPTKSR